MATQKTRICPAGRLPRRHTKIADRKQTATLPQVSPDSPGFHHTASTLGSPAVRQADRGPTEGALFLRRSMRDPLQQRGSARETRMASSAVMIVDTKSVRASSCLAERTSKQAELVVQIKRLVFEDSCIEHGTSRTRSRLRLGSRSKENPPLARPHTAAGTLPKQETCSPGSGLEEPRR
jgi:hypothetical protein